MICISWASPSSKQQAHCLALTRQGGFNYDRKYVGNTERAPLEEDHKRELQKDGYAFNNVRVRLGDGEAVFLKGREKLRSWRHFQLGWALVDPNTPIRSGERFCVNVNEIFLWILTPLEIIYVNDKQCSKGLIVSQEKSSIGPDNFPKKCSLKGNFTFGSGTLEGHLLAGEEMFSVEWEADDSVWYEILSFSKPAKFLSKATYPYVKWRQTFFAKQSSNAMLRAMSEPN